MLTETSAISGSKSPETRATPRRRPRVSQYDVSWGLSSTRPQPPPSTKWCAGRTGREAGLSLIWWSRALSALGRW